MANFATGVPSNFECFLACDQLIKLMNTSPGWCKLYTNPFYPGFAALNTDFVEANFLGYIAQSLAGKFPVPSKQIDGVYASSSSDITFTNAGPTAANVWGWYVFVGFNWYWAGAFPTPLTIPGLSTFKMALTWQGAALGLLCP